MSAPGYSALKGDTLLLHYQVRKPLKETPQPPLVILLHGVGGNETQLFNYAGFFPDEYLVIAARAPFCQREGRYAWFKVHFTAEGPVVDDEQAEKSRIVLKQFIDQVMELYGADPHRIFLAGFSQGAIMSASVGLTSPGKLSAIGMLSGRILKGIRPLVVPSPLLQSLRIFLGHGILDPVLTISYAREAREYLRSLGLEPEYREYDFYHGISKEEMKDFVGFLNGSPAAPENSTI